MENHKNNIDMLKELKKDNSIEHLEELRKAVNIFLQIKEASGRAKEDILKAHKDFTLFRDMLNFLYNPFILTGIKSQKMVKFSRFVATKEDVGIPLFDNITTAMVEVQKNNTGRDVDVKMIMNFINTVDTDVDSPVHDFLQEFFSKQFKCGVTATTINKVYGKGTIPQFKVMLAHKFEDHQHKINGWFTITTKIDGVRCLAIKKDGDVKFYTRQGKQIEGMTDLEASYVFLEDNYVYDGELILNDDSLPSDKLFRATQKEVSKKGEKSQIKHILFDCLPLDEFLEGKSSKTYDRRKIKLHETLDRCKLFFLTDHIDVVPILYAGKDKSVIPEYLQQAISDKKEGIMINSNDGFYTTNRSSSLLKVKKFYSVDLEVTGYEEGSGRLSGTLGALIVDYKGHTLNVGSGFSDAQRQSFWEDRENLIGRVIEVNYFEESKNQQGGISLRFPTFSRLREEGKEVSYD